MLLALDTSTGYASIALSHEDNILAEYTWRVENRHSVELLPRAEEMLRARSDGAMVEDLTTRAWARRAGLPDPMPALLDVR